MTFLATTAIISASAVIGIPVASLAARIANAFWRAVVGWIFVDYSMEDGATTDALVRFLSDHSASVGLKDNRYEIVQRWVPRLKLYRHVFYLRTTKSHKIYMYRNSIPILYRPVQSRPQQEATAPTFTAIRGTVSWNDLLLEAAEWADDYSTKMQRERRYFAIHRASGSRKSNETSAPGELSAPSDGSGYLRKPIGWEEEDFRKPDREAALDGASLTDEMCKVVRDFKFWQDNEKWYRERGIPWRWGCLLYGPPGSGKTSLVSSIARDYDVPIAVFDLATMDNHDFLRCWKDTKRFASPNGRIVLLEDFDTVFDGRMNILGSDLSYETVLNAIDGVEKESGIALFVTTNHLEKIDPALGRPAEDGAPSRPGRIDLISHIGVMERDGRVKLAMRILRDEALAQEMAGLYPDDVPAQFMNRCMLKAKELLWAKNV